MYVPPAYRVEDDAEAWDFVRAHPFATLAINGQDGPVLAYAPLVVHISAPNQPVELIGHVARANPFHATIAEEGCACVAIFRGPDAYVSPSLYPSKQAHGKVVPTWSYLAAEARGHMSIVRDPALMRPFIQLGTDHMEAGRDRPWRVDDAPADFVASMERGIVGIRLVVATLTAKRKISQGKPEADYVSVQSAFAASDHTSHQQIALEMQKESQKH